MDVRVHHNSAVIHVVHDADIYVVDRAVVIEVASAPVAALVAVTCVAIAVVDAAIVADVLAPIAGVIPVGIIPIAPVARGPQCALVGSLNPCAGNPVVAVWRPGPVPGRPDIAVARILWLVVVRQGRGRLVRGVFRLFPVARIVRRLILRWIRDIAPFGSRSTRVIWSGGQISRGRIRTLILCARLVIIRLSRGLILVTTDSRKSDSQRKQQKPLKSKRVRHFTPTQLGC